MEDKVIFEDLDLEFSDGEFEGVEKETLIRCKQKLEESIKRIISK